MFYDERRDRIGAFHPRIIVAQADLRFLRMSHGDAVAASGEHSESSLMYAFQQVGASGLTLLSSGPHA
jgi:hypothetical protein